MNKKYNMKKLKIRFSSFVLTAVIIITGLVSVQYTDNVQAQEVSAPTLTVLRKDCF